MFLIQKSISGIIQRVDVFLIPVLGVVLIAHLLKQLGTHSETVIIVATICGVLPVFINALRSIYEREWASMDTLASLALIFSMIEHEWASALFITLMFASARLLETITNGRLEASIKSLLKLKPKTTKVIREEKLLVIPTEKVVLDDLVIAIPLTYLRAISTAAKSGVLIKGSLHLEVLGRIDTVVFDKTGTLTRGQPRVSGVVTLPNISKQTLLELISGVVARSNHPLSKALLAYITEQGVGGRESESVEIIGGKGIVAYSRGERIIVGSQKLMEEHGLSINDVLTSAAMVYTEIGKSIMYVAYKQEVIGFCAFGDEIKEDAKSVIAELRTLGINRVVLLSGDNERAAGAFAQEVGIDEWYANLLPEDKVSHIRELSQLGVVAMVGDGVNDAAALAIAHVGIAMGGLGSDGAIESANIVLMHDNLSAIPNTIRLAHEAKRISIQDFWIWGISNVLGVTLVFAGFIGPAGAAAYNFISDFFPLFNSFRISFKESRLK